MKAVHLLLGVWISAWIGCTTQTGSFCRESKECRGGLVCDKPPDAGVGFGICQPARRGAGEVCLWSSECAAGLLCSNENGDYIDDRHGTCVPSLIKDLSSAMDQNAGMPDGGMSIDQGFDQGEAG